MGRCSPTAFGNSSSCFTLVGKADGGFPVCAPSSHRGYRTTDSPIRDVGLRQGSGNYFHRTIPLTLLRHVEVTRYKRAHLRQLDAIGTHHSSLPRPAPPYHADFFRTKATDARTRHPSLSTGRRRGRRNPSHSSTSLQVCVIDAWASFDSVYRVSSLTHTSNKHYTIQCSDFKKYVGILDDSVFLLVLPSSARITIS